MTEENRWGSVDVFAGLQRDPSTRAQDEDRHSGGEETEELYDNVVHRIASTSGFKVGGERISETLLCLSLIGLVSGVSAFGIDWCIHNLHTGRIYVMDQLESYELKFAWWVITCAIGTVLAVLAVQQISTQAQGSGIPEMKSILSGIVMNHYLSFRTLVAKIIGLAMASVAGLSIGKEGPFVHISSIYANLLANAPMFDSFQQNHQLRIQMLAAGCAVGVAVTFGAPVGGVLFSIEVTATYYMVSNFWKSMFCGLCGAFLFKFFRTSGVELSLFDVTEFDPFGFNWEMIMFALLGVAAGLIGAFFVWFTAAFIRFRRRHPQFLMRTYSFSIFIAIATAAVTFPFGELFIRDYQKAINSLFYIGDLDWHTEEFLYHDIFINLLLFIFIKFFLTCITITLPIPCGMFAPVFILGAAIGRTFGEALAILFPTSNIVPAGYAVVGAAALGSGVTRTISTAVIVFELTGELHHMLPCLLSVLMAVMVGNRFSLSIYDQILTMRGLPFLFPIRNPKSYSHSVEGLMKTDLVALSPDTTFAEAEQHLQENNFYSFPLVDGEEFYLVGSVQRGVLEHMVEKRKEKYEIEVLGKKKPQNILQRRSLSRRFIDFVSSPKSSPRFQQLQQEEGQPLTAVGASVGSEDDGHSDVSRIDSTDDLRSLDSSTYSTLPSYMGKPLEYTQEYCGTLTNRPIDQSPFQIPSTTMVGKVHFIFTMLGLSHAFVTNKGRLVGVITKKSLIRTQF